MIRFSVSRGQFPAVEPRDAAEMHRCTDGGFKKKKLYMRFYGYKQYCFLKSLSIILKVENPKYVKHIPPWSLSAASVDATTQIWLQRNKLDINIFQTF